MVKVSVLIPIFNVEKYLKECLDSIVNQSLKDIEIICVNDGSTDNSLNILNDYATKDSRFKVVSQKNAGCASASNLAMELAIGEYLYFMDSDDILDENALEKTYIYAKGLDADFLMFQAVNYDEEKEEYYKTDIYSMTEISKFMSNKFVVNYKDLNDLIFTIPVCPWSKLFKHEFIKKIDVKFPEGLIFEDNIFFWEVLFNANNIVFFEEYLYIHRKHSNSVMSRCDCHYIDSIKINNLMIDTFKKYGVFDKFKDVLYNRKINLTYLRFCQINQDCEEQFFKQLRDDFDLIVSEGLYEDYINVLDDRNTVILKSCLNSNSFKEFKYSMAYWDSKRTNEQQINIINKLENVNDLHQEEIFNLNKYNKEIKNENIFLKEMNDVVNSKCDNLEEQLVNFTKLNNNLKTELNHITVKYDDLKINSGVINQDNKIIRKRNSDLIKIVNQLNSENYNLKDDLKISNRENNLHKKKNNELVKKNNNLINDINSLNHKNILLKNDIDDLRNDYKILNGKNKDLVNDINNFVEEIDILKKEVNQYKKWMLSGFMIKVSVVIPVYNVEEFLKECLDSIVNQTLKEIEIICIDDGSTDKSLDILNYYARNDNRFTVISQENGGHAVATNRGMEIAKGKYLYLMDSDDILELTALEETYNYAEQKNVDFVLFQSMNYVTDEDRYYKSDIYSMTKVAEFVGDKVFDYKDLGDLIFEIPVTPWSKLYRNDFIKKIGAKFPEGLVFDDNIFFWDVLFNAKRIAFYHKYLFIRRWHNQSSTTAGDIRFLDSIDISNLMIDKFKEYGEFDKYKSELYNRKINLALDKFNDIKVEFKEDYFKKLNNDFKSIVSKGLYNDYVDVLDNRNKTIFQSCLNSETYKEFHFEVAYWDSQVSRRKNEIQIKNLNETLKKERLTHNEIESNLKNEIKDLKDKNNSLVGNNKILKDQVDYYSSSVSWKVTKPLRNLQKISSNNVELGKGVITFNIMKSMFIEDELIRLCDINLKDNKGNEVFLDLDKLSVIYDKSYKIPFNNLVKSTEFENCYEFPASVLGRGKHDICLKYGELYSNLFQVFIKDENNLFDFNVWLGTDFNKTTEGFDKFNVTSISSSDSWSDIGERSIQVVCNNKNDYQALVTPVQKVNVDDFISARVTIFNPEDKVIVRLFESEISSYTDVDVPPSEKPNQVNITKFAKTNRIQLLVISRVKQVFYADNFVITSN